jgi:hypothetical protein
MIRSSSKVRRDLNCREQVWREVPELHNSITVWVAKNKLPALRAE